MKLIANKPAEKWGMTGAGRTGAAIVREELRYVLSSQASQRLDLASQSHVSSCLSYIPS